MCWITIALRAHDNDLIAVRNERLALKPHPPIKRHRKVLDDNEDARQAVPLGVRNEVHLCVRPSAEANLTGRRAQQSTEPLAGHGVYLASPRAEESCI